jgi:hypothetical protein
MDLGPQTNGTPPAQDWNEAAQDIEMKDEAALV